MAASVQTVDGRQSSARRRRGSTTRSSGGTTLEYLLTAPAIYSLIVPLVLLDLWATFYQHVCFRVYGIARVRRADYFVVDRERLPYLNALEKANCAYCGYANGVISYAREIAARTEQYWCPIKHLRAPRSTHNRYASFIAYGDARTLRRERERLRREAGE